MESVGAESGAGAGAGKPTAPTAGAPAPTVKLAAAKPPAKTVGADAAAGAASGSVPKRTVGKVAVSKPAGAAGAGAGAGAGKTKGADKPEAASEGADLNAGMPVEELDVHIETLFPEVGSHKSTNTDAAAGTNEQILTQLPRCPGDAQQARQLQLERTCGGYGRGVCVVAGAGDAAAGAQLTCFTGAKVQILTLRTHISLLPMPHAA